MVNTSTRPTDDDDRVESEEDRHQRDGDADGLAEAEQEHPAEDEQQHTVMATACPCRTSGKNGFSSTWTEASAADSVIVMIHEVATKPSRTRTKTLPRQNGSRSSSIATDPCPCGLSRATRRYIGSMPSSVSATISSVASGDSAPAASAAMPGR